MPEKKLNRLTVALALAEEFGFAVRLSEDARIILVVHDRVKRELENRLRQINWRFIHVGRKIGKFRVIALVDSFR